MRWQYRTLLAVSWLSAVAGCGARSQDEAAYPRPSQQAAVSARQVVADPGPPPAVPVASSRLQETARKGAATPHSGDVSLNAGWTPVAFTNPQLTSLSAGPAAVGLAWWNGTSYSVDTFTQENINANGGHRGYWVFATAATNISYSGAVDDQGTVGLQDGWNLISLAGAGPVPGANLTVTVGPQPVPLNSVLFRTFYELQPNGTYQTVDVTSGGSLKAGRPYWVYAKGLNLSLRWPPPVARSVHFVSVPSSVSADSASNASLRFTVSAELKDLWGNRVVDAVGNVTLQAAGNGTLGGTTTVAAVNGVATFAGLSLDRTGSVNLTATSQGLPDSAPASVLVNAGALNRLAFTGQPVSGTAGVALPTVRTSFQDAQGNPVAPGAPVNVSLTSSSNNGTLSNATAPTDGGGQASFADLRQTKSGTGYTLTASATVAGQPYSSTPSSQFDILAASGSSLAFSSAPPASMAAGTGATASVLVVDPYGNRDMNANNVITLSIGTAPGTPNTPLLDWQNGPNVTVTAINGSRNLPVRPNNAGNWTTILSSPGLGTGPGWNFTVGPGSGNYINFTQQPPAGPIVRQSTLPDITVELLDAFSNRKTDATGSASMASTVGTLGGTLSRPWNLGLATFSGLQYTLLGLPSQTPALVASTPGASGQSSVTLVLQDDEYHVGEGGANSGQGMATDDDGDYVAAWHEIVSGNPYTMVQRFTQDGQRANSVYQYYTGPGGLNSRPSVTCDLFGGFVLTFQRQTATDSIFDIYWYNHVGGYHSGASWSYSNLLLEFRPKVAVGANLGIGRNAIVVAQVAGGRVNAYRYKETGDEANITVGDGTNPSVALCKSDNRTLVVYRSSEGFIWGRIFDMEMETIAGPFRIDQLASARDYITSCDMDDAGNSMIVWTHHSGSSEEIHGRCFSPSGAPLTNEFRCNDTTASDQHDASVSLRGDGRALVTWTSEGGQDGDQAGVYGKFYTPWGNGGPEFRVNTQTSGRQEGPAAAYNRSTSFDRPRVLWNGPGVAPGSVHARRY